MRTRSFGRVQITATFSTSGVYLEGNLVAKKFWYRPNSKTRIFTGADSFGGPTVEKAFQAACNGEMVTVYPVFHRKDDGSQSTLWLTFIPKILEREVVGIYVLLDDVTPEKLAMESNVLAEGT